MLNKRKLSDIPQCEETPSTPSKRYSKVSRLQGVNGLGVLDFNKPDTQSSRGINQNTPRKAVEAQLSSSGSHHPPERSTPSRDFVAFDSAQDEANPFWSPAQASQPGQETLPRFHSPFIPKLPIDSPVSSHVQDVLSSACIDSSSDNSDSSSDTSHSSSDDSDSSPNTSTRKPVFTPKKSVFTPKKSVFTPKKSVRTLKRPKASPTQSIPSPMQFLSSPSQAVLDRLIPLPEEESADDVACVH
ncbi:hypothetical protein K457DRAFT_1727133 [Linnemannia elongata AG-77]|uniref:Uncharacterized protein n=1 Tax=Linnemannia elongata AG-77 TaxID=1314771 RepID=A0A197JHH8_9FUNG|nr:hypothetical protein K457DRAFT_1727133 [Linnemannia elongata AG-77]